MSDNQRSTASGPFTMGMVCEQIAAIDWDAVVADLPHAVTAMRELKPVQFPGDLGVITARVDWEYYRGVFMVAGGVSDFSMAGWNVEVDLSRGHPDVCPDDWTDTGPRAPRSDRWLYEFDLRERIDQLNSKDWDQRPPAVMLSGEQWRCVYTDENRSAVSLGKLWHLDSGDSLTLFFSREL